MTGPRYGFYRMRMTWKKALSGMACALAIVHCDLQTAGTSVGTGNPTEIQVGFRNDSGAVAITGTMAVYASTQIPVPGFSPEPLISVPVTGASHAALTADAFKALADTMWPKGSIENGRYNFNVVVTGENRGSIMRGFAFRKDSNDFVLRAEDADAPRDGGSATVKGAMAPLVEIICTIDSAALGPDKDDYLFLYGTGITSKGKAGRFVFSSLPEGDHQVYLISLPRKGQEGAGMNDSLFVYGLSAGIESGKDNALSYGGIQATVPVPEALKGN